MSRSKGRAFSLHHYTKTLSVKEREFNRVFPLPPYFGPLIGDKKEVFIADLGAGMFSTTGSTWPGVKVNLYPSDEMADEYHEILKDHNIKPLIPVEKQNMERLTYPDQMFDIVHCVNALDHVSGPFQAIKEMHRVCKKGGYIYLRHHFNTGRLQRYMGEHQWNITMTIDRNCVFWGKEGGFLLSDVVGWFKTEAKKEADWERRDMIVSVYRKTTP
ncbi:MAG: class I SAM-dependent methyltransferase [Sphaerochaeta sp.]|jgi:SAM-dependent methyltransferase|nr:class I SAM-dependent methyltransferase [Sphaerochaeta sp.]